MNKRLRVVNDNSVTVAQVLKRSKDVRPLGLGVKLAPGEREAIVSVGRDSERCRRAVDGINSAADGSSVKHDSSLAIAGGGKRGRVPFDGS